MVDAYRITNLPGESSEIVLSSLYLPRSFGRRPVLRRANCPHTTLHSLSQYEYVWRAPEHHCHVTSRKVRPAAVHVRVIWVSFCTGSHCCESALRLICFDGTQFNVLPELL
jgi:hypothetical protein